MGQRCENDGCSNEARRRFCSERCQKSWHNARRPRRDRHQHDCVVCSTPFKGRADAKVCSGKCAVRLHRFHTGGEMFTGTRSYDAKNDAVYVWRPTSMPDEVLSVLPGFHLVKFGATSTNQGDSRIVGCARNNRMDYELLALCETGTGQAYDFEDVLLGLGTKPEMPYWYDGKTEFRLISDSEMQLVMELLGVEGDAQAMAA